MAKLYHFNLRYHLGFYGTIRTLALENSAILRIKIGDILG